MEISLKMEKVIFQLSDAMRHKAKIMELFVNYLNNFNKDPNSLLNMMFINGNNLAIIENYPEYKIDIIKSIAKNIANHDMSKIDSIEEFKLYTDVCYDLNKVEYNSPEYNKIRPRLDEGFALHADVNAHHPEFWADLDFYQSKQVSVDEIMDIECVIEMILDWCAAALARGYKLKFSVCLTHKEKYNISDKLMNRIFNEIYLILDEKDIDNDIEFKRG